MRHLEHVPPPSLAPSLATECAAACIDAVWPARCALCSAADAGDGLGCAEHRFETGLEGPRCGRCAAAIASALADGEKCSTCRARAPSFARVAALGAYRAAANAQWLLALKYGGRAELATPLGALLATRLSLEPRDTRSAAPTVLVPVPLHLARRIERGYDQAWLLARACGETAGLPVLRVLRRTRATSVQGAIDTSSRSANVRGAFAPRWHARFARRWSQRGVFPHLSPRALPRTVAGADVWLVDDVLTSGSTASECARALRRLGARSVSVLCVARP